MSEQTPPPTQSTEQKEPSQSFLEKVDKATLTAAAKLLGIPVKLKEEKIWHT
jgi:hypothetical protein